MTVKGGKLNETQRAALQKANIGRHLSAAHKAKLSIAGKKRITSPDTKIKLSVAGKGRKLSDETKLKLSLAKKGAMFSPEHKANLAAAHLGKSRGTFDQEHRDKISNALKGKYCGDKAANWRGGLSFEPYCPKFNQDLKQRVRAFFSNQCLICGKNESECKTKHSVHHVSYDKMICCNDRPVQFASLCRACHNKTNSDRARWESMLHRIIDEIYDGRSYFTKEEWAELQK